MFGETWAYGGVGGWMACDWRAVSLDLFVYGYNRHIDTIRVGRCASCCCCCCLLFFLLFAVFFVLFCFFPESNSKSGGQTDHDLVCFREMDALLFFMYVCVWSSSLKPLVVLFVVMESIGGYA